MGVCGVIPAWGCRVSDSEPHVFEALENFGRAVDLLTGVRERFIANGWDKSAAESATIALIAVMRNDNR
jgi:hypothetical protein